MNGGLLHWLEHYGYIGLALGVFLESAGLPIPGEAALLAATFAAAHGALSLPLVIATAAACAILGDNLGYFAGRRLGRPWLERYGRWVLLTPAKLAGADRFFARYGGWAVALARFVAGVRVVAALSAGVSRMPWRSFLVSNAVGAIAWATVVGLGGYGLGAAWGAVSRSGGRLAVVALVGVGIGVSVLLLYKARQWWIEGAPDRRISGIGWHELWIAAASVSAVLVFAKIAEDVAESETAAFDAAIRNWMLNHGSGALDALMGAISWLGSAELLLPLSLLAGWVLWRRIRFSATIPVAAAPLVSAAVILGLKGLFGRHRPAGAALAHALGYSFPSGHTTAATGVFLTLAAVLERERLAPRWMVAVAAVLPILVGISRVYLDVHWATDVIGGWCVGLLIASVCVGFYERLRLGGLGEERAGAAPKEDAGPKP